MTRLTKLRIFINIIGILAIVFYVSFLIRKDLILNGILKVETDFNEIYPMISVLYPEHRINKQGNHPIIEEEPIYFNVRSPIEFDTAKIEIEFQSEQDIVFLGVKTKEEGWDFKNHSLYNKTLDDIKWLSISDKVNTLWQKQKKFENMKDFLDESNSLNGVSAYDFELGENFILHDYQPNLYETIINNCLRGEHEFRIRSRHRRNIYRRRDFGFRFWACVAQSESADDAARPDRRDSEFY